MAKRKVLQRDNSNLPLYLFHQGTNYNAYEYMGAHLTSVNGKIGVVFRTWAPNAQNVSVVGDFNCWDINANKMIRISDGGVYELFIENLSVNCLYKFAVTHNCKTVSHKKNNPTFCYNSKTCSGFSSISRTSPAR